jgi:YHS domain-containing protein
MRLLILLAIVYFAYRALKKLMFPSVSAGNASNRQSMAEIDDVMVKDPFCEVYFPKRNGVNLRLDGKELYFCSEQCRDKFVAAHKQK